MATLALSIPKDWTPTYAESQILKKQSCWRPPTYIGFQAPVPPPPDYSTAAKVNARIREFCGSPWLSTSDKTFAKELKAFRACVEKIPCAVEDHHVSKWDIVRVCIKRDDESHNCSRVYRNECEYGYTLVARTSPPPIAEIPKPYVPAPHWTRRGGPPKVKV